MSGFAAYKAEVLALVSVELWWMHDVIVRCWNEGLSEGQAYTEIEIAWSMREMECA